MKGAATIVGMLAAAVAGCGDGRGDGAAGGSREGDSGAIVIGAAVARTGALAPYDTESTQSLQMRVKQINSAGGVGGRKLKVVVRDTRSDLARGSVVADELIAEGARILAVTADFDFGSPAAIAAQRRGVPAISIGASDPKFADKKAIGPNAFTIGTGTDAKASLIAEYAYNKLGWRTAYVLQDTSLEYTKSLGRYFRARWKELGGKLVGDTTYQGSQNVNVRAQLTKLAAAGKDADFIFLPGWAGGGIGTVIKQMRSSGITTPTFSAAAVDGAAIVKTTGPVSDVWYTPFGCFSYCTGDDSDKGSRDRKFAADFEKEYGNPPTTSYAQLGYDVASFIAAALEADPSASGDKLAKALETAKPADLLMGEASFSPECHKPSSRSMDVVEITKGKFNFKESASVASIPDIGDGNPCATR